MATELRPVEEQQRKSTATAQDLPARWAAQLRAKASEGAGGGGTHQQQQQQRRGGGRYRPTSSTTATTTTTSNRDSSLLSLPASPTTTTQSSSHPVAHQQAAYRHSAAPTPSYQQQHQLSHPSARSHASLPVLPSSSSSSSAANQHSHHHGGSHRHRDPPERVYHEQRYDAEFDRGIGTSRGGGAAGTAGAASSAVGSSSSRQQQHQAPGSGSRLFNPDAPAQTTAERRRERELRDEEGGAAPSSSSTTRHKSRSKREPVEVGDLGRRGNGGREQESKESLESEESATSGRPGSRSSKDGRQRRSRREEQGRTARRGEDEERSGGAAGGSSTSLPSQVSASRQLFDPRRDDPVRFAQSGSGPSSSSSKKHGADSRSFVSSTVSLGSAASVSDFSVGQEESHTTGGSGAKREQENPVVAQLRRAYREITDLEVKLQDENKAATAAATRDDEAGQGLRIQGGGKRYDDEYWVKLATGHKHLADAHYSFLQMALDPRLPASLHSLPQRYNIPTRLWQTAFHQLLERMRHAIVSAPPPPSSSASTTNGSSPPANVLEHLIEFIQYAYGHYSQLFEDPTVTMFRAAWIEQLGDLARYRMAVAGLASRVSAAQHSHGQPNGGSLQLSHSPEREARPAEAASIGVAALGDWEVEEQDSWRVIARDWYGQGVAETPGTGRLQHHLALLSKGDELKSLYHYVKSLTAAHPYLSARESILPLFEDEHQARRTQPDVTKAELFVHLHGMLFTKISLDDFEEVLERFLERLKEESYLMQRTPDDWAGMGSGPNAPFGDAEWFMLAVINVSALLQYGVEDGVLRKHTVKETAQHSNHHGHHSRPATNGAKNKTPQAIMLNPSSLKRSETASMDDGDDVDSLAGESTATGATDVVMKLNASTEDDPLVFRLAQRLTFTMLEMALQHPFRLVGDGSKVLNPYIILILTFLASMAQHSPTLRHLERAVPWAALVGFFNSLPSLAAGGAEVRMDVPNKLLGSPLPEDWCIRGMEWTGKSLFGRGYWRSKTSGGGAAARDEMAPPPIGGPPSTAAVESEMDALKFDLFTLDDFAESSGDEHPSAAGAGGSSASAQLASSRWRRVATLAAWLARSVPGLDYDEGRFVVSGSLEAKLRRWSREDEEAREAERASRASVWRREDVVLDEGDESDGDVSEEEEEDEDDSPAVRDLKARRRQLKAVIRQARQTTRDAPGSIRRLSTATKGKTGKHAHARQYLKVFPGYSILVFDTNILLTSMKLFRELIEAETWTIIVPLAVITELDGLRKNAAPLGLAASEAIEYLESAIRTHSRHLKVQTSRGNYLRDLSIRSESIDFSATAEGLSHDHARNMDDVILRAVAWQQEHFTSRLALVNPKAERRNVPADAAQVVLVTFDRNLRLKARARGLDAADESGMAMMLEESQENG